MLERPILVNLLTGLYGYLYTFMDSAASRSYQPALRFWGLLAA